MIIFTVRMLGRPLAPRKQVTMRCFTADDYISYISSFSNRTGPGIPFSDARDSAD